MGKAEETPSSTPPRRHVIRRLTQKFLRQPEQFTPLADFPVERCVDEPERVQLQVTMKRVRSRRLNLTRKYRAVLDKGVLELHQRKQVDTVGLSSEFRVDLAKVTLLHNEQRIALRFQVESLILRPIDYGFQAFKEAIHKHRLWAQEQKQNNTDKTSTAANSTVTASTDLGRWEMDGPFMRILENIKEMQEQTNEVLKSTKKMMKEMKGIAGELREFRQNLKTNTATSVSPYSTANPAESIATPTAVTNTPEAKETEEEEEDLDEETKEELSKPVQEPELLYSLESVRSDFENISKKALEKSKRLLNTSKDSRSSGEKTKSKDISLKEPSKKEVLPKKKKEEVKKQRRERLPSQQQPSEGIGLKMLYQLIVHKTGLPLNNYEPVGTLQLVCEELSWSNLLDLASEYRLPEDRMSFVTAFAVSGYSSSVGRCRKPFNPIHGETFDYEEAGWRFHAEQVSHHPPISAGWAEHKNWTWWNTFDVETSISKLSKLCDLSFNSPLRLRLSTVDGMEEYSWNKVRTRIENITHAPEQRKMSHEGTMLIRCSNGYNGRIHFKKGKHPNELTGEIVAPNERQCFRLQGQWDMNLIRQRPTGERETLFDARQRERFPMYYGFSRFTMGLNEMENGVPPSDSRLRQDMRAVEEGNLGKAKDFKEQLEKAQRMKAKEKPYSPLWFEPTNDSFSGKTMYVSNGKYWTAKEKGFVDQRRQMAETTV